MVAGISDLTTQRELRGLALPATRGTGGYFESKGPGDVTWGDVLLALIVRRGSRFMRRSLGSAVPDQLFEPVDEPGLGVLEVAATEAVERQMPHVVVTNIATEALPRGMALRVAWKLATDPENVQERLLNVPKTFISNPAGVQ